MTPKFLILGKGFIGIRLQKHLCCPLEGARIHSYADAEKIFNRYQPEILVNCIGHTGERNVDDCEKDIDKTLLANTFVPVILAELAYRKNVKLVHISSGCIFHFDLRNGKPISEGVPADFHDLFYSRSKIYSENALLSMINLHNTLVLRIRIPLDDRKNRRNLLDKLISFKKVIDVPNSITYVPDFLKAFDHLIKRRAKGVFHVVNKGTLRYPRLMETYKKYVPEFKYKIIDLKDLKLTRTNLSLSTAKLERTGFKVRPIQEVLDECVRAWTRS